LEDELYGIPEFNVVQLVQANSTLMRKADVTLDDMNGSDWKALASANRAMAQVSGDKVSVIG
jgi:multiple sugar transport system substrate-binding protein